MIRQRFGHIRRHIQVAGVPGARGAVGRRVAGQHPEHCRRQSIHIRRNPGTQLKAVLLRRGISGDQLRLEVSADHASLRNGKTGQAQPAVCTDDHVFRAQAKMHQPRGMHRRKRRHDRHQQRTRFLPAHPAAHLLQPCLQCDPLAVLADRISRVILLKDVVHRHHRRQVAQTRECTGVSAEFLLVFGKGVFTAADHLHSAVLGALAERIGQEFPDQDRRLEHLIKTDIHRRVAARMQHPADQIAVGQQRAHRQVVRRVFSRRRIPAYAAFPPPFRQRIHAAHAQIIAIGHRCHPLLGFPAAGSCRAHRRFVRQYINILF